jgi:hypothetical protein
VRHRASGFGAVAAGLALALVAGCSTQEHPRILGADGDSQSATLKVSVASCNRNPVVNAKETDSEVRLIATVEKQEGVNGTDDCADLATVTLKAPLGPRSIIDDSTGGKVEVTNETGG